MPTKTDKNHGYCLYLHICLSMDNDDHIHICIHHNSYNGLSSVVGLFYTQDSICHEFLSRIRAHGRMKQCQAAKMPFFHNDIRIEQKVHPAMMLLVNLMISHIKSIAYTPILSKILTKSPRKHKNADLLHTWALPFHLAREGQSCHNAFSYLLIFMLLSRLRVFFRKTLFKHYISIPQIIITQMLSKLCLRTLRTFSSFKLFPGDYDISFMKGLIEAKTTSTLTLG